MMRMLTRLLFVLALAGGAVAQDPFEGTEPDPVQIGQFLGIQYTSNRTESSVQVKIYDDGDLLDTITIQLVNGDGSASWYVDEGTGDYLLLEDPWGNDTTIIVTEPSS